MIKLAIIAPPNDIKKRGILKRWFKTIPDEVDSIHNELNRMRPGIPRWWDE